MLRQYSSDIRSVCIFIMFLYSSFNYSNIHLCLQCSWLRCWLTISSELGDTNQNQKTNQQLCKQITNLAYSQVFALNFLIKLYPATSFVVNSGWLCSCMSEYHAKCHAKYHAKYPECDGETLPTNIFHYGFWI